MRIVLQRVSRAAVRIKGVSAGAIDQGLLILLGVHRDDTRAAVEFLSAKCADIRLFSDASGKMNLSLREINGAALVVSQFTLFGDCAKGRRPSFIDAAPSEKGREFYDYFVERLRLLVPMVATGVFGAMMEVELVNDGPVTLLLER